MTAERTADPLLDALAAAQEQHHLFAPLPATVVVGVSGGADSVCLLHALAALADQWAITLHVAHIDHALRPTSGEDAAFVRELARTLDLPCHCLTLAPDELARLPGGREAAARLARQRYLHATAMNVTPPGQVPHVALAHHMEDQAETVLLHLVQGAGLRGLSGMRPVNTLHLDGAQVDAPAVRVVRPFLGLHRAAIRDYLVRHRLAWREDPTNADVTIARNRLRHRVLPQLALLNPAVADVLGRTAELLEGETARIERLDAALLEQLSAAPATAERALLDLDALRRLSAPDQRGVLRHALAGLRAQQGVKDEGQAIGYAHVEDLRTQLATVAGATGPHPIAAGVAWSVTGNRTGDGSTPHLRLSLHADNALPFPPDHPYLGQNWRARQGSQPIVTGATVVAGAWQLVCARLPVNALPANWRANSNPWLTYLDADAAGSPCLTTPVAGMRFAPLGMAGQTRALGDLFTDRKTPASLRAGWPIVVDDGNGQVLWVCGIQPGHGARVTEATTAVLCLEWEMHPLLTSPGSGEEQVPAQAQSLPPHPGEGRGGVNRGGVCAPT